MTILVTGASGFVGSAVVRALLARGEHVRVLIRPTADRRNLANLHVEVATGDLTDAETLKRAADDCVGLFHVAADYRIWAPRPEAMYAVNVEGTRTLMRAALAAGVRRIVHTSSVATLGIRSDGQPADEETPSHVEDKVGPYKRSKYLGEAEVCRLVREEGLPAVIVNPSTPVGPCDVKPTPTGRIIVEAAAGRMPAYVDTGLNVVHVDDVAAGHLLAYDKGDIGRRYILGGEDMSLRDILRAIAVITGRRPPKVRLPNNAILPIAYLSEAWARLTGREPFVTVDGLRMAKKHMFFSSRRAQAELGYVARPATDALVDAVNWFRANGYLA